MGKNIILITGTSSGFGREAALQYAKNGYQVIATMRDIAKADQTLTDHPDVAILPLDVKHQESINRTVAYIIEKYGTIDVLYNNAGYSEIGAVEETADSDIQNEFATNFFGPVNLIKAVLPTMRRRRKGHIINMSSMATYVNLPTMGFYSASKAALTSLSETLAKELKYFNIKVTNVEPGGFNTRFAVNQNKTKNRLPDYQPVYDDNDRFARHAIMEVGLGDLHKAVSLIVKQTLAGNPPLHLAVGMQGYQVAVQYLGNLLQLYKDNVKLTETTDAERGNVFIYILEHTKADKKEQMRRLLTNIVNGILAAGGFPLESALPEILDMLKPDSSAGVQQVLKDFHIQ